MRKLVALSAKVGHALLLRKSMLATAESCTGGWLAQVMTANAGSSQWFDSGFITYSNEAKQRLLGVALHTLQEEGAVSEATAAAMAQGALHYSQANITIAITGIAGPGGGSVTKPVGMVCFAVATKFTSCLVKTKYFKGDRTQIRYAAVNYALCLLQKIITSDAFNKTP